MGQFGNSKGIGECDLDGASRVYSDLPDILGIIGSLEQRHLKT